MKVCPTCHRPFGGKQRMCFACGKPILRRHKWHIVGCYIVHDDCSQPTLRPLFVDDAAVQPVLAPAPGEPEPVTG